MCGECTAVAGLHVPEDLVHMDIYDPDQKKYVRDGDSGHIVLTTLLGAGETCGTLLINYDTDDTTSVISKERCGCGRTHMRIQNPWRDAETIFIFETPINRIDIEKAVFQEENMDHLTGEYEAFVYGDEENGIVLRISVEAEDKDSCNIREITDTITGSILKNKPGLTENFYEGSLKIPIHITGHGGLELHQIRGRPKRLVDRREER